MKSYTLKKIKEWGLEGINEELITTALMHPSYDTEGKRNNQRLEFLGDAVLGLVLADYLVENNPQSQEGDLTRLRALLAQEATLAKVAKKIGLGDILFLGKGEAGDGGRERPSTLADALEAVIAAIYLSFGLSKASDFVLKYFGGLEQLITEAEEDVIDYKTALQEYAQSLGGENVSYTILSEEGPPHMRMFTAAVYYHNKLMGEGCGKSKKEAEKAAAKVGFIALKEGK
ncbi:MAG: ribonuclease III [Clostridiales bacterium]